MFKVNNKSNSQRRYWRRFGVFIVNLIHTFSTIFIVDIDQVNVWWEIAL